MKKLEYLNKENILTPKGIAASYLEINHEILMTELMFDNFFNQLTAEQICAILSVFIMDKPMKKNAKDNKKTNQREIKFPLPTIVHNSYEKILNKARELVMIKTECGLSSEDGNLFDNSSCRDLDDYIATFVPELMLAIFQWVNGCDFAKIIKLTYLFEGQLIRLIKRLRDIINQLCDASKAIGNDQLNKKLKECVEKIQRGIVFQASLYVDDMDDDDDDQDDQESDDEDQDDYDNNEEHDEHEDDITVDEETEQTMNQIFGDD